MAEKNIQSNTRPQSRNSAEPSKPFFVSPRNGQRRIAVIGAAEDIPRALEHPAVANNRFIIEAMIAVDVERDEGGELFARLSELIQERDLQAMLITGPVGQRAMRVIADLSLLHHCELLAVMPTDIFAEHDPVVLWTGDSPVVRLTRIPKRRWALGLKRFIDVVGAAAGLVLAAPLIGTLAVLVRLESPGSPFF